MLNKLPAAGEVIVFRKRKEPSFGFLKGKSGEKVSVISEDGKDLELDSEKNYTCHWNRIREQTQPDRKKITT